MLKKTAVAAGAGHFTDWPNHRPQCRPSSPTFFFPVDTSPIFKKKFCEQFTEQNTQITYLAI
jgi:hypothetical protein